MQGHQDQPKNLPTTEDATGTDIFYQNLTASAEAFISPELQERFRNSRIVVAGTGSIGNPIAMAALRQGAECLTVMDPDIIDETNLSRQEYLWHQVGKNKALMTALNMRLINPGASKKIRSHREGMTVENAAQVVSEADIVVDGVDIRALDIIWELHKQAAAHKKPVIVGYDLAGTAMLAIYRYDQQDISPLKGELDEAKIAEFSRVKAAFESGSITESQFLAYIYDAFAGPINPLNVPVEQFQEILDRDPEDTRSYQLGTTARTTSALAVDAMMRIVDGQEIRDTVLVDIPSRVRKHNPNVLQKLYMIARVLPVIRQRGAEVKALLTEI